MLERQIVVRLSIEAPLSIQAVVVLLACGRPVTQLGPVHRRNPANPAAPSIAFGRLTAAPDIRTSFRLSYLALSPNSQ